MANLSELLAISREAELIKLGRPLDAKRNILARNLHLVLHVIKLAELVTEPYANFAIGTTKKREIIVGMALHVKRHASLIARLIAMERNDSCGDEILVLLTPTDPCRRAIRVNGFRSRDKRKPTPAQDITFLMIVSEVVPFKTERLVELSVRSCLIIGRHDLGKRRHIHPLGHRPVAVDNRPSALWPRDRREKSLTTHDMIVSGDGSESEKDRPPRAVMSLDEIGMPRALNRATLGSLAIVCQDRIGGVGQVRPVNTPTARDGLRMSIFRAPLGNHKIVEAIFLIDMRSFGITSARALPDKLRVGFLHTRHRIDLTEPNAAIRVRNHITLSVLIPKERRVNAPLLKPDRLGPLSAHVSSMYDKVATAEYIGRYHIENAVVMTDGRCINPTPRA